MNIFALSYLPGEAARFHNNKHVSKMILESAQLLCSTLNLLGLETPYKTCHKNHPCRIWAGESRNNFLWLAQLGLYLGEEFEFRYGKTHKSVDVIKHCITKWRALPSGKLTKFALAMPDIYKVDCPIQSYRNYYIGDKKHLADWGKREIPDWYIS